MCDARPDDLRKAHLVHAVTFPASIVPLGGLHYLCSTPSVEPFHTDRVV